MHIEQGDQTVSFRILDLTEEVLSMVPDADGSVRRRAKEKKRLDVEATGSQSRRPAP